MAAPVTFAADWGTAFYSGGGTSASVPSLFPLAIGGRPYLLDERTDRAGAENGDVPSQREQTDDRAEPSEATLSTQGFWRRTVESWHHGGGQENYDRPESDPARFHNSAGVDPWKRYELGLLPAAPLWLATGGSTLLLAVAGSRLFVAAGASLMVATTVGGALTQVSGLPVATVTSLATDGSTVYVALGASGIYTVGPATTVATAYATGTVAAVAYAKGRLLAVETSGTAPRVFNVLAAGAVAAGNPLLTVPGGVFEPGQWATEGPSAIYIAGFVGDKSRIWRTAVKEDGSELDAPIIAGQLPEGQLVRAVQDYLGSLLLVGTDDRVWVGEYDGAGNVVLRGNIANPGGAVRAFEHQDRYVWYSHVPGALGRLDAASNVSPDAFQPAAAADLATTAPGQVSSVTTFAGRRVFGIPGQGLYYEGAAKVTSGTVETGRIRFGIGDLKNVLYADVRHRPLPPGASVAVEVSHDDGAWVPVGSSAEDGATAAVLELGQRRAESVRLRLTLTGGAVVTGVTLRALPAPPTGELWRFYIRLFNNDTDLRGSTVHFDSAAERAFLRNLRAAKTAVTVQHGVETFTGVVQELASWRDESKAYDDSGNWTGRWNGVQELIVKVVG